MEVKLSCSCKDSDLAVAKKEAAQNDFVAAVYQSPQAEHCIAPPSIMQKLVSERAQLHNLNFGLTVSTVFH